MADSTLAALTAATAGTGGLFYGTQAGADRKFTLTAAGAVLAEAADAAAQKTALALAAVQPFVIAFKNITVLTSGAPADVATVTIPSWCTRYRATFSGSGLIMAESAAGTLAGANFTIRDAASGGGNAASAGSAGPASTAAVVQVTATSTSTVPATASTLYLNQSTNSANAGVISVYLTIMPCL